MSPFLRALQVMPDVSSACRIARVGRSTVYDARDGSRGSGERPPVPGFREAWDEALAIARDFMERHAHQWATTGVPVRATRTVTKTKRDRDGNVIETTIDETVSESAERSATMMIFWLKAHYPERYRWAERVEASGPEGGPIQFESIESIDARIAELAAELEAAGRGEPVPTE